jgi:2-oxo-hept-3-ene-1,7-dioate hydratase
LMLSGSFTRPVWADNGDTLHADFGPLGSVSVTFR